MRRTWRLRPSWIVSSSRFEPAPPIRRARAGAVTPSSSRHAGAQRAQRRARQRRAREPRAVGLRHLKARMRQAVGELAVVGEQDQAGAVDVEPSDRVQAQPARRHQLDDRRTSMRVARASRRLRRACSARTARAARRPRAAARRAPTPLLSLDVTGRVGDDLLADAHASRARSARSAARREATPAWARYFASRIADFR